MSYYNFDFTTLTDNLNKDEVIIIDSHDDIFKVYQIHFWSKERISDILSAIKCPSFKSEIKTFKTTDLDEMRSFIKDQNHTKSIVIENAGDKISINLVYGDTVKIRPNTFNIFEGTSFDKKLKERYKLWEIGDCVWKPKKIRAWVNDFSTLKYAIEQLERFSNRNDAKFWMSIQYDDSDFSFSDDDTMVFNHSSRRKSDKGAYLIFTGDKLAFVDEGNYYNFRLSQETKESEGAYIKGKI